MHIFSSTFVPVYSACISGDRLEIVSKETALDHTESCCCQTFLCSAVSRPGPGEQLQLTKAASLAGADSRAAAVPRAVAAENMQGSFSGQRMVVQQHGTGPVRPQNLQICAQAPGRFKKSGIPQNMQGSGRIILPGQSSTGGEQGGRKVFTPGQHPGFKKYEREGFTPPPPNFRPPPGFMDMGAPKPADMPGEPKELLDRLRTTSGHWHQLAKFLPQLARAGYNTMMIEGETGLHRSEQDIWTVALQVTPDAMHFAQKACVIVKWCTSKRSCVES